MTNCVVQIERLDETLDSGQRVAAQDVTEVLLLGPAYISSPKRNWQQAAAFEGLLDASLMVHTAIDLKQAARVLVSRHAMAGEYDVQGVSTTDSNWRLELKRRPHAS